MTINPGMLIFCIVDSCIAFFLVFFVTRSKFGGPEKTLARTIASILGILAGIIYLGVTVWFNTEAHTISEAGQKVVYAAPIVLSALMIILTLLSQPPKKEDKNQEQDENESQSEESPEEETD